MSDLHVVFGAGPLGRWTAAALLQKGKRVRIINRSGKMDQAPAGAELRAGDAYDLASNISLTQGAEAVYQCAQPHYYEWAEKFPGLQRSILDAASANAAKLVVADNLYMYGQFDGRLREDFPYQPNTKKGRVRAAMATEVMEAHRAGKVRAAIGRASDFFGPFDFALTAYAMLPAVQGKTVNLMGANNQAHTFTYIKDFGTLLAELGTRDEALGQAWFTPSNPALTQADLVAKIAAELGRPVKSQVGGPLLMRVLGLFNKEIAEIVEMMYEWQRPYVVDTTKAEQAFGLRPTPLTQAIRETLEWCKSESNQKGRVQ